MRSEGVHNFWNQTLTFNNGLRLVSPFFMCTFAAKYTNQIIISMKKLFFLGLMLMTMTFAQAQLKVTPKMQKGDVKNYATTSVINLPGQGTMTMKYETAITVAESQANGYTLNMTLNNITSDAASTNIAGQLITAGQEMMQGVTIKLITDADGKVQKVANMPELQLMMDKKSDEMIDKMLKAIPQLGQIMPKETLKKQFTNATSEESILTSLQAASCPLVLNGKTLMTGSQEEFFNDQKMKMKRMYFVNGNNITSNGSLNMTKDELKALIIKQVEQAAPDQAEMVKQNIDQLMNSGMLKMDSKETATYEVQADGWLNNIKVETTNDAMGQKMSGTSTTILK